LNTTGLHIVFIEKPMTQPTIQSRVTIDEKNDDVIVDNSDKNEDIDIRIENDKYFDITVVNTLNNSFKARFDEGKLNAGDSNYKYVKKYFEKYYCKILCPSVYYQHQAMRVLSSNDIKHDTADVYWHFIDKNDKGELAVFGKLFISTWIGDIHIIK
jgi:hypothetical protein